MTSKAVGLFVLGVLLMTEVEAQQYREIDRTLDTVFVKARRVERSKEVNIGTRVSKLDEGLLLDNQTKSLSEVLADHSTIYIKSLGQGALSTSSFRGTSSSHTQVNWNGININPAMSSSFDFSQIPAFFTDGVSLYHGSSHLKGGSGGLGGSINLSNQPAWNDPSHGRVFVETGSNDTYTGAAMLRWGNRAIQSQTRLFYQQSDNDFRYLNKVLQKEEFYERRKEAQYKQAGVMQELYYKIDDAQQLSGNFWYQYGDRRLPQPIIVNVVQHEKQQDTNFRSYLGYDYDKGKHRFIGKIAYLRNSLRWNKWYDSDFGSDASVNRAQSVQVKTDYTYLPSSRLRINGQLNYTYDCINATNYTGGAVGRHVILAQGNVLWNLSSVLAINGQVMGEQSNQAFAPTFSAAIMARLIPERLTLKGNIASNYKNPSLNDLYWQPGGNRELKPEKGLSYDITLSGQLPITEELDWETEVTYYRMNVDNWIMWLPGENWFWQPRNVQKVLSEGIELQTACNYTRGDVQVRLALNYTYSNAKNRERRFEEDATYGKQLPYIPLHKANTRWTASYKQAFVHYTLNYTGVRYTSEDESYKTNAYTIQNIEAGYHFAVKGSCRITPKISISNLFDAYYESTQYYPMPLRSFMASVMVSF